MHNPYKVQQKRDWTVREEKLLRAEIKKWGNCLNKQKDKETNLCF